MHISRIKLTNIRAIASLEIPLKEDALPRHAIVIGGNSTCKTSILRSIAIGMCNDTHASALLSELPGSLVGPFQETATIEVTLKNPKDNTEFLIETTIRTRAIKSKRSMRAKSARSRRITEDEVDKQRIFQNGEEIEPREFNRSGRDELFACGYGAGRATLGTESWARYRIIDSVYTLFRYDQPLQNPELILHRLRDFYGGIEPATKQRLITLLGLSQKHQFEVTRSGVVVSGPRIGRGIPLDAVADGYRGTFTWLCDLVGWAMLAGAIDRETGAISGIVMIDELEQHLHPTIQVALLRRLRKVYPGLQLIATSHSPVIAVHGDPNGLYALKRRGSRVSLLPEVDHLEYYSVEDALVDDRLFAYEAETKELQSALEEYRSLAGIPDGERSPAQQKKLRALGRTLTDAQMARPTTSSVVTGLEQLRKDLGL